MTIQIKRIYEPASKTDGYRILVDRLWPRGIKKETAPFDKWLKEIAPSTNLRKWFNHEPEKWTSFCEKYYAELNGSAALGELLFYIREHKNVTLLFSSRDEQHNHALALQQFINDRSVQ